MGAREREREREKNREKFYPPKQKKIETWKENGAQTAKKK